MRRGNEANFQSANFQKKAGLDPRLLSSAVSGGCTLAAAVVHKLAADRSTNYSSWSCFKSPDHYERFVSLTGSKKNTAKRPWNFPLSIVVLIVHGDLVTRQKMIRRFRYRDSLTESLNYHASSTEMEFTEFRRNTNELQKCDRRIFMSN